MSDTIIFRMVFPIQYELLLGKNKKELELELQETIIKAVGDEILELPPLKKMVDKDIYYSTPQQNYQIPELSNGAYYVKYDDEYCIILDSAYIEYSLCNILLIPSEYNPTIDVTQNLYGYQQKRYIITLWQWLSYCQEEDITLYVAFKEENNDSYIMTVLAENRDFAYNHLLTFTIPRDFLNAYQVEWKMTMNGFIPTHNLKTMYKQ